MAEADPFVEIGGCVSEMLKAIFLFIIAPFLPDAKV
jgi:hypothetical protein